MASMAPSRAVRRSSAVGTLSGNSGAGCSASHAATSSSVAPSTQAKAAASHRGVTRPAATPPQRYVLQLADGWVQINAAEYLRTQDGIVAVTFRIAHSNGAAINSGPQQIATLPEEYRPVGYVAHAAASTMSAVPAIVWVGDDGVIYASAAQEVPESRDPNSANWPGFAGTMVFCAN